MERILEFRISVNYEEQFICNQLQDINNLNINKNNENRDNLYIIIAIFFISFSKHCIIYLITIL